MTAPIWSAPVGASTPPGTDAAESVPATFPIVVEHGLGETTIDAAPRRIVALGSAEADTLFALDVAPVGILGTAFSPSGLFPWQEPFVGDETTALATEMTGEITNLEELAALEPDLIFAGSQFGIDEIYDDLSAIAPTIGYVDGYGQDSWQTTVGLIGEAIGRDADALVAETQGAIDEVRAAHPELGEHTAAFSVAQTASQIGVLVDADDSAVQFFTALGFDTETSLSDQPQGQLPGVVDVTIEQLDLVDVDALFIAFPDPTTQEGIESSPLFDSLPSVVGGGYTPLDVATWLAVRTPSPLAIPFALEAVAPTIERLAAG